MFNKIIHWIGIVMVVVFTVAFVESVGELLRLQGEIELLEAVHYSESVAVVNGMIIQSIGGVIISLGLMLANSAFRPETES